MKKPLLMIILLLVSMVNMVGVSPVHASPGTTLSVDPSSTVDYTMLPQTPKTIRPMADGTYTDWTNKTLTIRPDGLGTDTDWTGRILTLNPNGSGTYTDWTGNYMAWDDWPDHNGDTDYVFAAAPDLRETSNLSDFTDPGWTISKVAVFIVAKRTVDPGSAERDQVYIMMRLGSTDLLSTAQISTTTASTSYLTYSFSSTTKPGGSSWTWADVHNLQAGVKYYRLGTAASEIRVTQLYVKVLEAGNWEHWDEETPDGDTTYVSSIATAQNQSSTLQNVTSPPAWTISKVQVSIVARLAAPSNEKIKITLRIGATRVESTTFSPTYTYQTFSYVWATPPGGGTWDWGKVNNTQAGVQSVLSGLDWSGDIRVTQLYVVVLGQDGTYTEWDEATQNGDTDYVSATMKDMKETSEMENIISPPTWTIARVRVVIYARATETTDETVQPILVVGGDLYPATTGPTEYIPPTTSYAKCTGDWGYNPKTEANWTWPDINLLQAGVRSAMGADGLWTGELRVTQLCVEVAGPRFTHRIMVADVTDLFSWQVKIYYNPTILDVTGVSLPPNHVFTGKDYMGVTPVINNTEGYVLFGVTLLWMDPMWTFNGTGVLCQISYLVKAIGATPLHFSPYGILEDTFLLNRDLGLIPASTEDGFFRNKILGDVNGDGKVDASDLFDLSKAYGSVPGNPNWDERCDFNWDGKVDASDLFDLGKNYGRSI